MNALRKPITVEGYGKFLTLALTVIGALIIGALVANQFIGANYVTRRDYDRLLVEIAQWKISVATIQTAQQTELSAFRRDQAGSDARVEQRAVEHGRRITDLEQHNGGRR